MFGGVDCRRPRAPTRATSAQFLRSIAQTAPAASCLPQCSPCCTHRKDGYSHPRQTAFPVPPPFSPSPEAIRQTVSTEGQTRKYWEIHKTPPSASRTSLRAWRLIVYGGTSAVHQTPPPCALHIPGAPATPPRRHTGQTCSAPTCCDSARPTRP